MSRLRVACIVEGHGEAAAVPILLERIWYELIGGEYIEVVRPPIRQPKDRLTMNKDQALDKAVELATLKVVAGNVMHDPTLILILVDADSDLPCVIGPAMLQMAKASRTDKHLSCVVANVEFETWLIGGSEALTDYLDITAEDIPESPESTRNGKGWIEQRIKSPKYSESVDQARLTAKFDLQLARARCPSFDKLCRDLEKAT